jgi:hypothetical protein
MDPLPSDVLGRHQNLGEELPFDIINYVRISDHPSLQPAAA